MDDSKSVHGFTTDNEIGFVQNVSISLEDKVLILIVLIYILKLVVLAD